MNDSLDDGALLAALRAAVAGRAAVPAAFAEAARNAYAWHGIDAELASISYDSLLDAGQLSGVRSESASIRALTFESARFSIGVEITDDALFGQLVPPQPGTAELESRSGAIVAVPIDDVGCFTFGQRPDGPFRLRCHTEAQADVRTGWVTLLSPARTRAAWVLVLSPFGGRSRHPLDWGMHLAAQVDELRARGSRVVTTFPDSDSEHMFGANAMDLSLRPPAARAGYDQGKALAGQFTEFWR